MQKHFSLPLIVLCLVVGTFALAQEDVKEGDAKPGNSESEKETPAAEETTTSPKLKGPDVVLIQSEQRTIYEFRHNGQLMMIKVVPKKGRPYYLVPEDPTLHGGDLERANRLVARWVIKEF